MKRKMAAVTLALAMTTVALAGCGDKGTTTKDAQTTTTENGGNGNKEVALKVWAPEEE